MTGNTATTAQAGDQPNPRTAAIRQGRQADSARRRQRVIAVLGRAATDGTEISASGIARAAGVDRSFLYRHRDLLDKIHALEATPPAPADTLGPAVTRASLQADLLAAGERAQRLNSRVRQLEKRLSEVTRRKSLAGIRSRRSRRRRRPQPEHHPPRTAGHRPAPATRRTRPGPRRRARRQPRTHRPTQHRDTTPMTRRTRFLHNTCRDTLKSFPSASEQRKHPSRAPSQG